jgi:hypothetical protein
MVTLGEIQNAKNLIGGAIKWTGKGTITITSEQGELLRASTPVGLKRNPELAKFLDGFGKALLKDVGKAAEKAEKDQHKSFFKKPKKKKNA